MTITDESVVRGFADLFAGRVDVYGSGTGSGQCIKDTLAYDHYEAHLRSAPFAIGVYPQRDNGLVKWGCSDIDIADYGLAYNVHAALNVLGVRSHVELTRSGNYHVWIFATDWTVASAVRRTLLVAHDIARVPPKEINPKQETLEGQRYGNYVRLPYPGGLTATPKRQVVLDHPSRGPIHLRLFLDRAYERRASPETLADVASMWKPPVVQRVDFDEIAESMATLPSKLNGLAWTVFKDGPLEDGDRSSALFKLACACKTSGLTPSEALWVVSDADLRWGKYSTRPDGERWLRTTVERAYQ